MKIKDITFLKEANETDLDKLKKAIALLSKEKAQPASTDTKAADTKAADTPQETDVKTVAAQIRSGQHPIVKKLIDVASTGNKKATQDAMLGGPLDVVAAISKARQEQGQPMSNRELKFAQIELRAAILGYINKEYLGGADSQVTTDWPVLLKAVLRKHAPAQQAAAPQPNTQG